MPAVPSDPPADDQGVDQALSRAAAFDDYLAGFSPPESVGDDAPEGCPAPDSAVAAGLLDTILLLRQAAAAAGAVPATAGRAMPRSIGRHAILRLAGEGGFSHVWEGFDTILRRPVAVKVRRPEMLLSEDARRRFVREAEIAARLVHPHIVTIYEVDEDRGIEFIAAEFCSGGSLAAWLARHAGPRPPREAARLVRALAGAAAYAHAAGIIHRDIKPANVLLLPAPSGTEPVLHDALTESDGSGAVGLTVKLGDFGLGKLQEADDGHQAEALTQLTRSGASIGTPAWMAPEQIDRSFGAVGTATDVHALGLLLDRLLTGRAVRGGRTDAETYRQVLLDEPPPADRVVRSVPRDLAAIASKCLAKHPRDRYASATDLADDLTRWLEGRPTIARPLSTAGRLWRAVRQRPMVAGLAAAALAAMVVAGWAGMARSRDAWRADAREQEIRRQRAVAELRRGFEALAAGNVAGALSQLKATRDIDAGLAESLAGRWLLRRTHGEQGIVLAAQGSESRSTSSARPRDLYSITVARSGSKAAAAGADGTVHLLRGLEASPTVQAVAAHDEVNGICFSTDETRLATVGQDGRLRWWDVTEAGLTPRGEVDPRVGPLYAVAFSPDGRALAIGGEDRAVRLVDLEAPESMRELFRFEPPPGRSPDVESIVFVDARTLAASCGDQIVLLDAEDGRRVRPCEFDPDDKRSAVIGSLTVSPDGTRLLGCGTDSRAHVWDTADGRLEMSLEKHPAWVQGCAFSPDGARIATACRDGAVRMFDAARGAPLARMVGHVGRVWSVAFEPRGTLLSAGADGTVRRWDSQIAPAAALLRRVPMPGLNVYELVDGTAGEALPASAAANVCAAEAVEGFVAVDCRSGDVRQIVRPAVGKAWALAYDGGHRRLAVSFRTPAPPRIVPLAADGGSPWAIPLPDGADPTDSLLAWTPRGELVVWSIDGGLSWCASDLTGIRRVASTEGVVHVIAAAPAGPPRVALAGARTTIHSLPSGIVPAKRRPPIELPVAGEGVAVAWSPDGSLVACGTRAGAVQLFDAATGAPRGALAPHERRIEGLAFAPDGRILVSADQDSVRISDVATLTTFDELRHGIRLDALCLAKDGDWLVLAGQASGSEADGRARLAVMELPPP
jgi:WD40 repeat protein/tRNA A-37 threonylcarbamoyl transferase component Bud32